MIALFVTDCKSCVLAFQRTAFFAEKTVAQIYNDFMREVRSDRDVPMVQRKFERHMRTVRCVIIYDTSRSFMFDKLTREHVGSRIYNVQNTSIVEYMKSKKGMTINGNLPGCHRKF